MNNIKSKNINIADLRNHSIWAWSSNIFENEDSLVPVDISLEGLSEPDTLLIHAIFTTASGSKLEGLIVYDPDSDEVFAIEFFIVDDRYTLNKNLPDLSRTELLRYERKTGENIDNFFPIRYQIIPSEIDIPPGAFNLNE